MRRDDVADLVHHHVAMQPPPSSNPEYWSCSNPACGYCNAARLSECEVCEEPKPKGDAHEARAFQVMARVLGEDGQFCLTVPESAQPGNKLQRRMADGQELVLTMRKAVPPGSLLTLTQNLLTKAWKCSLVKCRDVGQEVLPSTPPATSGNYDECWFCGMDPPDHPGRHCPARGHMALPSTRAQGT